MKNLILECKGLAKSFDGEKFVLKGVDLSLSSGEVFLLQGPNGIGKTTFLRILTGMLSPTEGSITFCGKKYSFRDFDLRSKIGFCSSDEKSFFQNASALENLKFFGKIYGLSGRSLDRRITDLCHDFKCEEYLNYQIQELSTGYKKRFSLVRSFLHHPKLILLDEPFGPLDQEFRKFLVIYIRDWVKTHNAAAIVSSHTSEAQIFSETFSKARNKEFLSKSPEVKL